jgi:hypothetical protein
MRRMIVAALLFGVTVGVAQNYRCDWNVVGIAGGSMSSTGYRSDATAGQTAVGQIAGTAYQAFIGFWQIDTGSVGIQDEAHWNAAEPLVTALHAPFPNPSQGLATVRYSMAAEGRVSIELLDLSGRIVRTLIDAVQTPGRHSLSARQCSLAGGIYFLRMRTMEYETMRKLVVQ